MSTTHPPNSVVVGVDGSQAAVLAAEWAIDEAISREVPLRLIHVVHDQVEAAPIASVDIEREFDTIDPAPPVKVETALLRGDPAATLIAESCDADMVCVGSVGMGRLARELLGSTAASLAEAAGCPVAIIRNQQRPPTPESDLIVVAVNDSPQNDDVVQQAMQEAQLRHAPRSPSECGEKTSVRCPMTRWTGGSSSGAGATRACMSMRPPHEPGSPTFSP